MSMEGSLVLKVGPPCWDTGLHCPILQEGVDPSEEAKAALSAVTEAVCGQSGLPAASAVGAVDSVFTLVQLALDSRRKEGVKIAPSPAEEAFRCALAPGALGLVTRLTTVLQPRDPDVRDGKGKGNVSTLKEGGSDGGLRDAVVAAAKHLSAMEQLMAGQKNTSALLIAHNALAKLLKGRWSWLIGGVLDAPRLLGQLCLIYRDGLIQLKSALAEADVKRSDRSLSRGPGDAAVAGPSAGEIAHLKKFGKLLATFGTRMSCLLRHLGPECPVPERREAYRLFAQAAAGVCGGLDSVSSRGADADSARASALLSLAGVVAGVVYPRAVEAFLAALGPAPCAAGDSDGATPRNAEHVLSTAVADSHGDSGAADGVVHNKKQSSVSYDKDGEVVCRCYEGIAEVGVEEGEKSRAAGRYKRRRRQHDACEALEALRHPAQLLRQQWAAAPGLTDQEGRAMMVSAAVMENYTDSSFAGSSSNPNSDDATDLSIGTVLLLCEVLRCGESRLSTSVSARLLECCGWLLEHLSSLFPGWVEKAAAETEQLREGTSAEACWDESERMFLALCHEAAAALACFVGRRAVNGEFDEAQMQLLEGCACHPHPLCREIWCKVLKVFLRRCDDAAQMSVVQTFAEATLDPGVSPRCRRRLARAISGLSLPLASGGGPSLRSRGIGTHRNGSVDGNSGLLCPSAVDVLRRSCLSRLKVIPARVTKPQLIPNSNSADVPVTAVTSSSGSVIPRSGEEDSVAQFCCDEGGVCALDLIRDLRSLWQEAGSSSAQQQSDHTGSEAAQDAVALASASGEFVQNIIAYYLDDSTNGEGRGLGDIAMKRRRRRLGSRKSGEKKDAADVMAVTAACNFLADMAMLQDREGRVNDAHDERSMDDDTTTGTETMRILGGAIQDGRLQESTGVDERGLAAVVRLLARANPDSLPQLCASITTDAEEANITGAGLLALSEGLSLLGRRPFPANQGGASVMEAVLVDGFASLFGASLWPVTASAMQALEEMGRHADPLMAAFLPKIVPENRLQAFKARLARRMVTLDGNAFIGHAKIRERGAQEWGTLSAAAAAATPTAAGPDGPNGEPPEQNGATVAGRQQRQVVLREGDNLKAMAGFLSSTVVRVDVLNDQAGGGVCITLEI